MRSFLCLFIAALTLLAQTAVLHNPYESIRWESAGRHKANFHTHTTNSDGANSPEEMIEAYTDRGYTVLAITDHNKATWSPGFDFINEITMIEGNEFSTHHHSNSLFTLIETESRDIRQSIEEVRDAGGIVQINHPGRADSSSSWYRALFNDYDNVFALEVYNRGDRYSNDRKLWDRILSSSMPTNAVWATGNDDSHSLTHVGFSYQVLLTPGGKRDKQTVRDCLMNGQFYVCHDINKTGNAVKVESVSVTETAITIEAHCDDSQVTWISCGRSVHQGKTLPLDTPNLSRYVRAVISGTNGEKTLLQPIALTVNDKVNLNTKMMLLDLMLN